MESRTASARILPSLIAAVVLLAGCSDGKGAESSAAAPNTAAAAASAVAAAAGSPAPAPSATAVAGQSCASPPVSAGIYGEIAAGGGTISGSTFTENSAEPLEFLEVRYAVEDPSPLPAPTPVPSAVPTPEPPLTITRYYGTYSVPAFEGVEAPESQSNPGAPYAARPTTGCLSIVLVRGANDQTQSSATSARSGDASVSGDLPAFGPGGLHRTVTVDMGPIISFTIANLTKNSGNGSFQFLSGSTVVNGTVTILGSTTTAIR
jgi:hypothetical protein